MNKTLLIYLYKERIVNNILNNQITIIEAETGSGKSTQVPQYLYEAGYDVIVTEPRRLAAVSLANRVAEEMETTTLVGYQTAFETNKTEDTRILFCTDGLQLIHSLTKEYKGNTILVIDEVHEWNMNIETLVAWVKKLIKEGNKLKVVIMSATMESEKLSKYFSANTTIVKVSGKVFPVRKVYKKEKDITASIIEMTANRKNCLVFLERLKEINLMIDELKKENLNAEILSLHSNLTMEEQTKVFRQYDNPKIIVSTNIAQTSLTIPDIDAVIDNGKEKRIETMNNIEGLFIHNISKADCNQRAGRAGRVKDGTYILCSDTNYDLREDFPTAEIQRSTLEQVVLRLAAVKIDAVDLDFFHQPD